MFIKNKILFGDELHNFIEKRNTYKFIYLFIYMYAYVYMQAV